jgi:glucose dehydrogenase
VGEAGDVDVTEWGAITQWLRQDGAARNSQREDIMTRGHHSLLKLLLAASTMTAVCPVLAADVTPDRLINADREPHNWLMNHRTYDGQRFSPLARIDRGNVKNLKLAYAVPLGGGGANEYNQATPLSPSAWRDVGVG